MIEIEVRGEKRPLELTVQGYADVCALCPEDKLENIGEMAKRPLPEYTHFCLEVLVALSNAAEEKLAFERDGYQPRPLTMHELTTLTMREVRAFTGGLNHILIQLLGTPEVEVEPDVKKKTAAPSG